MHLAYADDTFAPADVSAAPVTVPGGPLLLSVTEAAQYMGISRTAMYALVGRRIIGSVKLPGVQHQYIRRADVDTYVAGLSAAA